VSHVTHKTCHVTHEACHAQDMPHTSHVTREWCHSRGILLKRHVAHEACHTWGMSQRDANYTGREGGQTQSDWKGDFDYIITEQGRLVMDYRNC